MYKGHIVCFRNRIRLVSSLARLSNTCKFLLNHCEAPFATGHKLNTNIIMNTCAKVEKNTLIQVFYEAPLQITLKHIACISCAINFNIPGKFAVFPDFSRSRHRNQKS